MPARPITLLIIVGWLATLGWFSYRELWPTLFPEDTPPFVIELADEVGPEIAGNTMRSPDISWEIYRDDQVIGHAVTEIHYFKEDDSFSFMTRIQKLSIEAPVFKINLLTIDSPGVANAYRLSRSGELQQVVMQTLDRLDNRDVGEYKSLSFLGMIVRAKFVGTVVGDKLQRSVMLEVPHIPEIGKVELQLEPAPAPEGSVLNPLQPVPKIKNLKPGRRWRMQIINPLADLIQPLAQALAKRGKSEDGIKEIPKLPSGPKFVDAEVLDELVDLEIGKETHRCYVIEYRGEERPAHTYVRVRDGAVMRQEAFAFGTLIALQRQ
jgi:hypothetical protein